MCIYYNIKKSEIVSHFVLQGHARSTIYDHINRMDNPQIYVVIWVKRCTIMFVKPNMRNS